MYRGNHDYDGCQPRQVPHIPPAITRCRASRQIVMFSCSDNRRPCLRGIWGVTLPKNSSSQFIHGSFPKKARSCASDLHYRSFCVKPLTSPYGKQLVIFYRRSTGQRGAMGSESNGWECPNTDNPVRVFATSLRQPYREALRLPWRRGEQIRLWRCSSEKGRDPSHVQCHALFRRGDGRD